MVFSLIMKLIKIIQAYPTQVGEYFSDTIGSKRIPVWIFLYFIPQCRAIKVKIFYIDYF
jgi:hypothetical protein